MKTGKKVMILLLIFVAAVIVYFIHPVGKKEEHGITEYTAMEKAKFQYSMRRWETGRWRRCSARRRSAV